MSRRVIARGKFTDPRHIELAESVGETGVEIEVSFRQLPGTQAQDVFDVLSALAAGSRSKADIDQQDRDSWDER